MSKCIYFARYGSDINISLLQPFKGGRALSKYLGNLDYRLSLNCKGYGNSDTIDIYLNKVDIMEIQRCINTTFKTGNKTRYTITNKIVNEDRKYYKLFNYPYILCNLADQCNVICTLNFRKKDDKLIISSSYEYKIYFITRKPKHIQPYNMSLKIDDTKKLLKELNTIVTN